MSEPEATLRVAQAAELSRFIGRGPPPSPYVRVSQADIDAFADLTGDRQWIHVDAERAARELPGGRTIVPGQLLLALVPGLLRRSYAVDRCRSSRVAGLRQIRFRSPVAVGQPFRLAARIVGVMPRRRFTLVETACSLELEDGAAAVILERTDVFYP